MNNLGTLWEIAIYASVIFLLWKFSMMLIRSIILCLGIAFMLYTAYLANPAKYDALFKKYKGDKMIEYTKEAAKKSSKYINEENLNKVIKEVKKEIK